MEWSTSPFRRADPVSSAWNNFNNDTCIPDPTSSCSGKGYAAFLVNAISEEHVALGVQFARKHKIRLIVKATGRDYMGRYAFHDCWTKEVKTDSSQIISSKLPLDLDIQSRRNHLPRYFQANQLPHYYKHNSSNRLRRLRHDRTLCVRIKLS